MHYPKLIGAIMVSTLVLTACSTTSSTSTTDSTSSTTVTSTTDDTNSTTFFQATPTSDSCQKVSEADIIALFDQWNESLKTGDSDKVVEHYASKSVLLPTTSNQVSTTPAAEKDYFDNFLAKKPEAVINTRWIEIDCNYAIDAGTYTFNFNDGSKTAARYTFVYGIENGEWKILTQHSSAMPEAGASTSLPAATTSTGSPQPKLQGDQCTIADSKEIAGLFDKWNAALQTEDPKKVVELYAQDSILLPTVFNKPRFTAAEKEDYFTHFLEKKPSGTIDERFVALGCNTAADTGHYTFTYADGTTVAARYTFTYRWDGSDWLISAHHSSALPES